jgi:hypothetical protein
VRSLSSITLTVVGLIVAAPSPNGGAVAANSHAKQAHEGGASACRPHQVPITGQLIGQVLSQPWFIGHPPPMYINGVRICVDPHGYYVPSEYQ